MFKEVLTILSASLIALLLFGAFKISKFLSDPGRKYFNNYVNGIVTPRFEYYTWLVGPEQVCWYSFIAHVETVCGVEPGTLAGTLTLNQIRMRLGKTSARERFSLLVFYYKAYGINDPRNHIATSWFEGSSCTDLNHITAEGISMHRWWVNFTSIAVDQTMYTLVSQSMPRVGGPMKPHKLYEQSMMLWNQHKTQFQIYSSIRTESVLNSSAGTQMTSYTIPGTGPEADYFNNATAATMNFYVSLTLNTIGIGSHNSERMYFRCVGAPQVTANSRQENLYYTVPTGMTAKAVIAGILDQYNAIVNYATANNNLLGLHKVTIMLEAMGYRPTHPVTVRGFNYTGATNGVGGTATAAQQNFTLAHFMWPGGFMWRNCHDDVSQAVRDDLNYIAGLMTAQKSLNRSPTAGSGRRAMVANIPDNMFQFFKKGQVNPGVV